MDVRALFASEKRRWFEDPVSIALVVTMLVMLPAMTAAFLLPVFGVTMDRSALDQVYAFTAIPALFVVMPVLFMRAGSYEDRVRATTRARLSVQGQGLLVQMSASPELDDWSRAQVVAVLNESTRVGRSTCRR